MIEAYLDNNATTQTAPEVIDAMRPYFDTLYQNASSVAGESRGLKNAVSDARRDLGTLLGTRESQGLVFTSGATESNNWAIYGVGESWTAPGHLITSAIEHPSVLASLRRLESRGWQLTILNVDGTGVVSPDDFAAAVRDDTRLVSIMMANNETGIVQPIEVLSRFLKARIPSAFFHSDATQAVGKIPVSLSNEFDSVDLLSLSAHKFHGPKGCGALFIRDGVVLPPFMLGGGQERDLRSGTMNVPAIVGLGVAARLAQESAGELVRIAELRDGFEHSLQQRFPDIKVHGFFAKRLPNTSCFSIPGCSANSLADILACRGIYVGTGAACSSGALHPPQSLLAMGVDHDLAAAAIRVSLSRYSVKNELEQLIDALEAVRAMAS